MMGFKELQALVGPSLLNADLSNLFLESKDLLEAGADFLVPLFFCYPIILKLN
jgi:hypothetical protein